MSCFSTGATVSNSAGVAVVTVGVAAVRVAVVTVGGAGPAVIVRIILINSLLVFSRSLNL